MHKCQKHVKSKQVTVVNFIKTIYQCSKMPVWTHIICSTERLNRNNKVRMQRRSLRDNSDPLSIPDNLFKSRFRLSKAAFRYVLNTLDLPKGSRSTYIPPIIRLAVCLEIFATGGYQSLVGNGYICGLSKSAVSYIVSEIIFCAETKICPDWIKFSPNNEETKEHFYTKYGIPGVVGSIDGTHIYLLQPKENEHMFLNRKSKHSLNAMAICDHKLRINAINCRFGGAAHDSFVWSQSNEKTLMERHYGVNKNSWLLGNKFIDDTHYFNQTFKGDKGYPLQPWLLTPYRSPSNEAEINFNEIHGRARSSIERCFGVYKGIWRILLEERKSRYSPEKVASIANICAALHNIRIYFKIANDGIVPPLLTESQEVLQEDSEGNHLRREAELIRTQIANALL